MRRYILAALVALLALVPASASAQTGPVITFFKSPLPIVGSQLSDSTLKPQVRLKDGWTVTSPNGIANAFVDYSPNTTGVPSQIWSYPPSGQPGGADKVTGKFQWSQEANFTQRSSVLLGRGTDEQGNTGPFYSIAMDTWLFNSNSASYSAGWQTSTCKCYTSGQILYSTKAGATASFQVSNSRLASFVSDTGPDRGVAALTINGHTTDVSLGVGSRKVNRIIVWNSGYLKSANTYTLTVRVISGRVDVEGFITQFTGTG